MIRTVPISSTCGALNRRFRRDMEFQHDMIVTGPGGTHAGPNAEMALRYGSYKPARVRFWRVFGLSGVVGKDAALWASLSDLECAWVVIAGWVAVRRKVA